MSHPFDVQVFIGREAPDRFQAVLDLRIEVFVVEQECPLDEELDGQDDDAVHVALSRDGAVVGTARLRTVQDGAVAKIERVAVKASLRGTGLGRAAMMAVEAQGRAAGCTEALLGGQLQALRFYEGLGYVAEGPVFLDANIEHRWMRKPLTKPPTE